MELMLVRHAIAFAPDPQRWPDDELRPLSPRGEARAREAALGLRRLVPPPVCVLTSPLLRTRQTAEILTRSARWPRASNCVQLRPGTPAEELFEVLRAAKQRMGLIGHDPDLGHLLGACLGAGAAFEFKKMGLARVSFRGTARAGRGRLLWFVSPRLLRAAGK